MTNFPKSYSLICIFLIYIYLFKRQTVDFEMVVCVCVRFTKRFKQTAVLFLKTANWSGEKKRQTKLQDTKHYKNEDERNGTQYKEEINMGLEIKEENVVSASTSDKITTNEKRQQIPMTTTSISKAAGGAESDLGWSRSFKLFLANAV